MDQTLAQIEDRVSPSRIKDRQVDRLRGRWDRARTAVMGSDGPDARERAGQVGDQMSQRASEMGERAKQAPDRAEEMTRGNPLAAGLIAFGLGALAGASPRVAHPSGGWPVASATSSRSLSRASCRRRVKG